MAVHDDVARTGTWQWKRADDNTWTPVANPHANPGTAAFVEVAGLATRKFVEDAMERFRKEVSGAAPPEISEDFVYRTVFGYFPYADGQGKSPAVEFNPNVRLTSLDGLMTTQEPYRIALGTDGRFEIDLLTTDSNPTIYPTGWCWEVREDYKGGRRYWFVLPYDDGLPIALSAISPLPERPPIVGVSSGPRGPEGQEGPQGPPGRDGAFVVWKQPERPELPEDALSPGDLFFEMDGEPNG